MCGISADFDGTITICPATERLADEIYIERMKLRGKVFDLKMRKDDYTVTCDGRDMTSPYGTAIVLQ